MKKKILLCNKDIIVIHLTTPFPSLPVSVINQLKDPAKKKKKKGQLKDIYIYFFFLLVFYSLLKYYPSCHFSILPTISIFPFFHPLI